jgi:hypothetical protein
MYIHIYIYIYLIWLYWKRTEGLKTRKTFQTLPGKPHQKLKGTLSRPPYALKIFFLPWIFRIWSSNHLITVLAIWYAIMFTPYPLACSPSRVTHPSIYKFICYICYIYHIYEYINTKAYREECIYIYIYIYICIYTYKHTHIQTHIHIYMYIYIHLNEYLYIQAYKEEYIYIYIYIYINTYTYMYTYTYIYTYI